LCDLKVILEPIYLKLQPPIALIRHK